MSKVLLINGSPNEHGCTYTALCEVAASLEKNGIETEMLYLGKAPVPGCIACGRCRRDGLCSFGGQVNDIIKRIDEFDGLVAGSPVYYASASGQITSFMDRLFYAAGSAVFAALQSIPRSLVEAAAIDGAGPIRRFFRLSLPLIAPVSFFLLVVNLVYAFFDTFPVIDAATAGGPVQATTTLIYKIYREGFAGLDLSASAAQSVVLMFLVIILTVVQFRYVESKVRYQ